METLRPSSRDSSKPAGTTGHGDADQQPVPVGADEADGNLNSANPESGSNRSEVGLHSGEANTSKESCGCSGQDACDSDTKNEGDNERIGASEQRGGIREEKRGTSRRPGIGRGDVTGTAETAADIVARIEGDVKVVSMQDARPKEDANGESSWTYRRRMLERWLCRYKLWSQ